MKKRDLFFPILKNTVPPQQVPPFSKNILRPKQNVRLQPERHHEGVPVAGTPSHADRGAAAQAAAPSFERDAPSSPLGSTLRSSRTSGPSSRTNLDELARRPASDAPGVGDRDRRRIRHRARPRRGARIPRSRRQPARRRLRRGDPEHADPRPDLLPLLRAARRSGIRLEAFTVAWLSVMIWGGAFNTENFRAGFEAVPAALPRGGIRARVRPARRRS